MDRFLTGVVNRLTFRNSATVKQFLWAQKQEEFRQYQKAHRKETSFFTSLQEKVWSHLDLGISHIRTNHENKKKISYVRRLQSSLQQIQLPQQQMKRL